MITNKVRDTITAGMRRNSTAAQEGNGSRLQLDAQAEGVAVLAGVLVLVARAAGGAGGAEVAGADDQHADDLVAAVTHVQRDGEEDLVCTCMIHESAPKP